MPPFRPSDRRFRRAGARAVRVTGFATLLFGLIPAWPGAHDGARAEGQEPSGSTAGVAQGRTPATGLLVLAASSLTDVLPAISGEATGAATVRFSFDATSRLAPQIAGGAPADVFVSADVAWMRWLAERGAVDPAAARVVAGNELVVVVPRGRTPPSTPADLSNVRRIAIAGENVPAGRYARAALLDAGLTGTGTATGSVEVLTGGSVRSVLEWVARGEVGAGVVYRTDAIVEPAVEIGFAFGPGSHPPIEYWAAPIRSSARAAEASAFVEALRGEGARARFAAAGFSPPSDPTALLEDATTAQSSATSTATAAAAPLPSVASAIRLSLLVALLATAAGLVPAIGLGWLLARREFRGKSIVSTMVLAPLVIPPVVTGFLLLTVLGTQGPVGGVLDALGVPIPFTIVGAAIAALVVGLPLYVLSVRGAFEAIDPQYEELSWTLGVPPRTTFLRVSLPLALPGIAAGAILAFARSLGEFGATIVLAGNVEGDTRTIALAVYTLLESPTGREATWTLVGASVTLSLLALLGYEALSRRQRRRLERDHG